ncbi:MAG TPA: GDSL family lipase, partial [Sarcina sp.]|nr:GDSL family lipase [Sarcina sp.]
MRLVSVLGDSISTFEGYNPEDYAVYYDKYMQDWNGLRNVEDTWWARVIRSLHARLCVNNSYSGSRVTGETFPAGASEERLRNLGTEENDPDLILIYMGLNDFAGGIDLVSSLDS